MEARERRVASVERAPGVLVVRRIREWEEYPKARRRAATIPLSREEIYSQYRGVDGRPWPEELSLPYDEGLAPMGKWPELLAIADEAREGQLYDALILAMPPILRQLPDEVSFLGFDVGYYESSCSVFSSLFHECIYGHLEELALQAPHLNRALLFSAPAAAEAYCRVREVVRAKGADVEDDDCRPIAVFGRPRFSRDNLCPVCGYDLGFPPWRGESASDEFCDSCGIQFGYHDAMSSDGPEERARFYSAWREKWISRGMIWSSSGKAPAGWNPRKQLSRVFRSS